jgi:cellulose synthase A
MITDIIPSQHTGSVVCCAVHSTRNLLISGDEDGCLCFTDLTNRSPLGRLRDGDGATAIPSVTFNPTDEHSVFAAVGASILRLDLRKSLGEEAIVDTFRINTDEINSIDVDPTGSWIAAGDDSGEIQIISLRILKDSATATPASKASPPSHKTLRRGHTNICNAVSFRPSRPNEILSGGLDSRMVRWDFTKLRQLTTFTMTSSSGGGVFGDGDNSGGQFCNPPMINSLAVCHEDGIEFPSLVAVARGDGCVALYNGDAKATASGNVNYGSGGSGKNSSSKNTKASKKQSSYENGTSGSQEKPSSALFWSGGAHQGGHTAAVNCVSFLRDTAGNKLISVGNDRKVCIWDWKNAVEPVDQIAHRAKINWACSGSGGEVDAVLADVAGKLLAVTFKG